jgi:hypothetical protein
LLLVGAGCITGMPAPSDSNGLPPGPEANEGEQGSAPAPQVQQAFFVGEPQLSFNHVQPGVRSEFYVDLQAAANPPQLDIRDANDPGPVVTLTLSGPGIMGEATETHPYEAGQKIRFTWNINRLGTYKAEGGVYLGSQLESPISGQLKVQ